VPLYSTSLCTTLAVQHNDNGQQLLQLICCQTTAITAAGQRKYSKPAAKLLRHGFAVSFLFTMAYHAFYCSHTNTSAAPCCRQSPLEGLSQVRPTDEGEPHEMNQKGGPQLPSCAQLWQPSRFGISLIDPSGKVPKFLCYVYSLPIELQFPDHPPLWVRLHLHHNLSSCLIMPLSRYGRAQTSESEATGEEGGVHAPDPPSPPRLTLLCGNAESFLQLHHLG
jgi:hypothetical protein